MIGHGGISVTHSINTANLDDPSNFQVQVSGEQLQTALAAVQQKTSAFSTTGFLPDSYVTYITGNLNLHSTKAKFVILTPLLSAPEPNQELNIRNYLNFGGLSISNANGRVHVVSGLTTGVAGLIQELNVPVRHLLYDHDTGHKFRVGSTSVLSLEEATGATVQVGLSVSGNCTISGNLIVGSTNILQALGSAQCSTQPIAIEDVTGLSAALAGKEPSLSASSVVKLS